MIKEICHSTLSCDIEIRVPSRFTLNPSVLRKPGGKIEFSKVKMGFSSGFFAFPLESFQVLRNWTGLQLIQLIEILFNRFKIQTLVEQKNLIEFRSFPFKTCEFKSGDLTTRIRAKQVLSSWKRFSKIVFVWNANKSRSSATRFSLFGNFGVDRTAKKTVFLN